MGFQFIREECYARIRTCGAPSNRTTSNIRSTGKRSAREIIEEAIRAPGAAPHVGVPNEPRCHHGLAGRSLLKWLDLIERQADKVTVETKKGLRKQRSDTPILMGVIATFPAQANDKDASYVEWRERTIEFFKKRYGSALISVLEHTDEAFGHLHAQVTNNGMSVKTLHAGHREALKAAKCGATKKAQSEAYKNGARQLQEEFYKDVGVRSGLARIGAGRQRLTRAQWHAEKQSNAATAERIRALEVQRKNSQQILSATEMLFTRNLLNVVDLLREAISIKQKNSIKIEELKAIYEQIAVARRELKGVEESKEEKNSNIPIEDLARENTHLRRQIRLLSNDLVSRSDSSDQVDAPLRQAQRFSP